MNRPVEGAFRAILAYGCFAAFHALGKELGRRYSTSQVLATGSLAAAALTAAVLFGRGEATAARLRPHLLLLRGAISGATALCMFHALGRLPITTTYSLSLLGPVVAAVLSALLLGERLDRRRVLAALAGFAGVLVVLRPAPGSLGSGHLAALSVAVLFAGNAVLLRRIGGQESRWALVLAHVLGVLVCSAPFALPAWIAPSGRDLAAMALIGLLMSAGHALLVTAFQRAEVAVVGGLQYTQLLWGAAFGAVLLGEVPPAGAWPGVLLLIGSGTYILLHGRRAARQAEAPCTSTSNTALDEAE